MLELPMPFFQLVRSFVELVFGKLPFPVLQGLFWVRGFARYGENLKCAFALRVPFYCWSWKVHDPITSENGARYLRRQFRRHCLIARQSCSKAYKASPGFWSRSAKPSHKCSDVSGLYQLQWRVRDGFAPSSVSCMHKSRFIYIKLRSSVNRGVCPWIKNPALWKKKPGNQMGWAYSKNVIICL